MCGRVSSCKQIMWEQLDFNHVRKKTPRRNFSPGALFACFLHDKTELSQKISRLRYCHPRRLLPLRVLPDWQSPHSALPAAAQSGH